MAVHPFDVIATHYDAEFTDTRLGRWLREAVWAEVDGLFEAGDHVLELGCGTGEDALWLAQRGVRVTATDAAPAMLEVAARKAEAAGVDDRVSVAQLDVADIGYWILDISDGHRPIPSTQYPIPAFDGVFSNFGALNCLPDRRHLAGTLAPYVRRGGYVAVVLMGPLCPWEIGWYLVHGKVRTAFRRFRSGVEAQLDERTTVRVWYPSPRRLRAEFAPYFRHVRTVGIGVLLPPSYLSHFVEKWPRLFDVVAVAEGRLGRVFPGTWLNDHYLSIFERVL